MIIEKLDCDFTVCKVKDFSQVNFEKDYCFIGKTDEENSLVCSSDAVPDNAVEIESGWKAFRIKGVLDFSLIGVLSKISTVLAENGIGIFAVSTFNTDYIFTKSENFAKALKALENAGYTLV